MDIVNLDSEMKSDETIVYHVKERKTDIVYEAIFFPRS